jgi:predicted RNase H-like HicB family nuclease
MMSEPSTVRLAIDRFFKERIMRKYHAAYYRQEGGWYVVSLLDFPGVNTQGKNLREARYMVKDALQLMVESYLDEGIQLPKPNPSARDKKADLQEEIVLEIRARALVGA